MAVVRREGVLIRRVEGVFGVENQAAVDVDCGSQNVFPRDVYGVLCCLGLSTKAWCSKPTLRTLEGLQGGEKGFAEGKEGRWGDGKKAGC